MQAAVPCGAPLNPSHIKCACRFCRRGRGRGRAALWCKHVLSCAFACQWEFGGRRDCRHSLWVCQIFSSALGMRNVRRRGLGEGQGKGQGSWEMGRRSIQSHDMCMQDNENEVETNLPTGPAQVDTDRPSTEVGGQSIVNSLVREHPGKPQAGVSGQ